MSNEHNKLNQLRPAGAGRGFRRAAVEDRYEQG